MDLLLIKRAQKGDTDAFVRLIEKHKLSLYKVSKSYLKNEEDIADVMQDTILSAYEHIGRLKQAAYFKTWITRILINHCKDRLREQKRFIPTLLDEDRTAAAPTDDREFYRLLEDLPEGMRPIFLLYYGEGFNTREIAQILEMNENTVKSKLQRGRKKLKEVICKEAIL